MTSFHYYRAFGLVFRSPTPLNSMTPSETSEDAGYDVDISLGEVEPSSNAVIVDEMQVGVIECGLTIDIADAGRFMITGGESIVIQPAANAKSDEVQSYLLGTAFGVLLHQRAILPLHANAIEVDGSAVLFCGDSGAGKSTLAAFFQDIGFRLLTDDVCAVRFDSSGALMAWPGIPRLKLWGDAMAAFDRPTAGLPLAAWTEDKFEIPVTAIATGGPFPVAGIYHLREAGDGRPPGIHRLFGLDAANAVTANIYRRRMADLSGASAQYLRTAVSIVRQIPVYTMNRRWGFESFGGEAADIQTHLRQLRA